MSEINENTAMGNSGSPNNDNSNKIKNIIGVMSGKGGVGKSTVTTLIARELNNKGFRVGILDADITGPSIPRLMNMEDIRAFSSNNSIIPVVSDEGIKMISLNFLIEDENSPVIWRGPMIGNIVQQFYNDVLWEELDYLLIDMPPGTGDVALTVMQSIPLTGIVMVSIPQNLVSMIVAKAVNMANQLKVPVIGLVQNMSYVKCPGCSEKIEIFEAPEMELFLRKMNLELLGELPMTKEIINYSIANDTLSDDIKNTVEAMTEKIEVFCKKNKLRMFLR
ncbi:Mrp/NBP35 family ATP-binding protein [Peptostreptococcus sp. D1]|uniref:Mrp/NBP35 family ATP-binding protein n=1 Tax=Peptostreptococcus sp. D1 TaxID=72304 RepID=UPI0008E019F9|nr:Mrp/NBP35 family ATP-binding protein [Peptostreptococcus sp. D1]SFE44022.1 Chromosome partitioning ATPase, Mrp family, contains Fe-S cluster [Peptostreptococcus sp. D1]